MDSHKLFSFVMLVSVFSLSSGNGGVDGEDHHHRRKEHRTSSDHLYGFKPTKLFVFGDSYADTGNIMKPLANSWKVPYGITFPGKPSGRFSDGRVSTDFLAKLLGLWSPVQYQRRNVAGAKRLRYGMNFAYGGTGVFDTLVTFPNMTTQINLFRQLIHDGVFNSSEFEHSMALVSVAGNDYNAYLSRNRSLEGLPIFIEQVIDQMTKDLKRIHELGVSKIVVPSLQPLGCLPGRTVSSSFQRCNGTENLLVNLHNLLLKRAVAKLNNDSKPSTFVILDFYNAFMTILKNNGEFPGNKKFEKPLKPCCYGVSSEYSCSSVDEAGVKKYTLCDHPKSAFFWDAFHPTQEGWRTIYSLLAQNLSHLLSN